MDRSSRGTLIEDHIDDKAPQTDDVHITEQSDAEHFDAAEVEGESSFKSTCSNRTGSMCLLILLLNHMFIFTTFILIDVHLVL